MSGVALGFEEKESRDLSSKKDSSGGGFLLRSMINNIETVNIQRRENSCSLWRRFLFSPGKTKLS